MPHPIGQALHQASAKLRTLPDGWLVLLARLGLGGFFWRAGRTKVDADFELTAGAKYLFEQEYNVPLLDPIVAAWMAAGAEHLFAVMLVIGLGTRLSALGLLGMTAVIQIFVYPGSWPDHLLWTAALLLILARGPGVLALDRVLCGKLSHCKHKNQPEAM